MRWGAARLELLVKERHQGHVHQLVDDVPAQCQCRQRKDGLCVLEQLLGHPLRKKRKG